MKLEHITNFEMCDPLELTAENPIGLVTGMTGSGKSWLIEKICNCPEVHNVIHYNGHQGFAYPVMKGPNYVYITDDYEQFFEKVEKLYSITKDFGFKCPTLVIIEEIEIKCDSVVEPWFQRELRRLVSMCQLCDIRILVVQQPYPEWRRGLIGHLDPVHYEIIREGEARRFARVVTE